MLCAALLVGMAKTGVSGVGMLAVPLMAIVFGGKQSAGVLLVILICADVIGAWYYNRHADWQLLRRILPLAFVGILLGTFIGHQIDDESFKVMMAVIIFLSVAIMVWRERANDLAIPSSTWFVVFFGLAGGFASMVGNVAGSVMTLYFLSMRLPKNQFIGTAAWFFLIVNLLKMPFHIVVWETITVDSALLSAVAFPAVALGAYLGIRIVREIPEQAYRYLVIAMLGVTALLMLL